MSASGLMKQVVPVAGGMLIGVGLQHFIIRPLEQKLVQKMPMAGKFLAIGEIILGGAIAIKAKNPILRGVGLGIMAGGVQTGAKQLNLYKESPAVQGVGDYTTVQVPINGEIREMLNGVIRDSENPVRTSLVAGGDEMGETEVNGWTYTTRDRQNRTNLLAGIYGLTDDPAYAGEIEDLAPKGYNY